MVSHNDSVLSCTFALWLLKYGLHEGALNIFDTKVDYFSFTAAKLIDISFAIFIVKPIIWIMTWNIKLYHFVTGSHPNVTNVGKDIF